MRTNGNARMGGDAYNIRMYVMDSFTAEMDQMKIKHFVCTGSVLNTCGNAGITSVLARNMFVTKQSVEMM